MLATYIICLMVNIFSATTIGNDMSNIDGIKRKITESVKRDFNEKGVKVSLDEEKLQDSRLDGDNSGVKSKTEGEGSSVEKNVNGVKNSVINAKTEGEGSGKISGKKRIIVQVMKKRRKNAMGTIANALRVPGWLRTGKAQSVMSLALFGGMMYCIVFCNDKETDNDEVGVLIEMINDNVCDADVKECNEEDVQNGKVEKVHHLDVHCVKASFSHRLKEPEFHKYMDTTFYGSTIKRLRNMRNSTWSAINILKDVQKHYAACLHYHDILMDWSEHECTPEDKELFAAVYLPMREKTTALWDDYQTKGGSYVDLCKKLQDAIDTPEGRCVTMYVAHFNGLHSKANSKAKGIFSDC